ncbi:MAG: aconitate hydratase [Candidatus Altiarchaeales archaeon]|nr:aconitate hydratase [Candidatus Altiarchaeales archaeon]MBD3415966.1 aconitate hydratase [Candidatus Altiarchaeales archaeon]
MASVAEKILSTHVVGEEDGEIAVRIDQTLTQDATGTMAFLQFEALDLPKVRTELSVSYVDHNTLQTETLNADDHRYLQTAASKYGVLFSRPGNGICHQVHLERFAKPGRTLLGSDSHTPTSGGMGMLAVGAGGLDVALAMAGHPFWMKKPKIVGVELTGELKPWVSAKDVILEILRRKGVKGGVGKILEYHGEGVETLSVPDRATISNMGAEMGATTSLFPSDKVTKSFLASQDRESDWAELKADGESGYDEKLHLDLSSVEPMVAKPHSPDNVFKVSDEAGLKVDQVCIGSCTNSSLKDLMMAAQLLDGRTVHPDVSLTISPGSKQVLKMLSESGHLTKLIDSGARILECACGPCIGMGQSPKFKSVSVRTFNRNFQGRSGTEDAGIYLTGVEAAVAAAIKGELTDPLELGEYPDIKLPGMFSVDDSMIIRPTGGEIIRGNNIKPLCLNRPLSDKIKGDVLIKVGDNISTDHILPAGSKCLPLRSNIPAISEYVFHSIDKKFPKRAKKKKGGFIVAGSNYGQGSSREHAALAPMYLGVKAVLAKSFARIHRSNLINFGILPLEFNDPSDYDDLERGDEIAIKGLRECLARGDGELKVKADDEKIKVTSDLTRRQREIILAGGLLNYARENA